MLYYEDFERGKTLTEKQYQIYLQRCLQCYENDGRFREIVDYMKDLDCIGTFKVFKTMLGFRSFEGDFIIDIEYPVIFNKGEITVYLAKLDYKEIDYKRRVKVNHSVSYGHPRIYIETDSEVQYLKNLINYIISNIC